MVDQCCMLPRATLVGQREVTDVLGSAEEVAWLLINQQLLERGRERQREREGNVHYTCTCTCMYYRGNTEFGVVQPHRTSSNHCTTEGKLTIAQVRGGSSSNHCARGNTDYRSFYMSSGWFNPTEPTCTLLEGTLTIGNFT